MPRGDILTTNFKLVVETCYSCSTPFAMAEELYDRRQADKQSFWCPNGHSQHYVGISDKEKIRRLQAQKTHLEDQRQAAERSAQAYKGHFNRVKGKLDRVEAGVCPHCNRSFEDLRRHMESKHPGVVDASR